MTISKTVAPWLHTALVGFCTGVLAYLSAFVVGAPLPGVRATVIALLVAGCSKAAGALVGKINTPSGGS
jgi:hypothetical protein